MLHKEIPFLRIGLPLVAGIVSGLYFKPDPLSLLLISFLILSCFVISLFFNRYQVNLLYGFSLTLAFFICGSLLYRNEKDSLSILRPEMTTFSCTLSDYPEKKEKSQMLTLKLNNIITSSGPVHVRGSILIYSKVDSSSFAFIPGDLIILRCSPVLITNRGNPNEFDYRFYMENHGIKYYSFIRPGDILDHRSPSHKKLIYKALIVRQRIIEMYRECGIEGERLALVAAITLGQKSMLDPEQKQNFMKAGVMHIMAVSGLHAVILSVFVFNMLFFMKGRFNILRILITIFILWAFAFVTGLTPSVLRATFMFTFLQAGNLMHRRVNGINSVLASAFILALIKPSVIFDAGFLLSYSAVIFIICFYRDLYIKLHFKNWLFDKIWQSIVVTLVAQAGTLPLTIMLFNRFPSYFVFTNLIIVPLSSLMIILGCLIPLLYPVLILSKTVAIILNFLTGLTDMLTARASSLPGSNIENIGIITPECILLMAFIFSMGYYLLRNRSISVFIPATLIILLVVSGTIKNIQVRSTNELIVYNTRGLQTIGIKAGKKLNVYCDTLLIGPELKRHYATLGLKLKMNLLQNENVLLRAGEKKILICKSLTQNTLYNCVPDVIILTGRRPFIANNLTFIPGPKPVIVLPAASPGFRLSAKINVVLTDSVHFVRKSGAFIKRI